MCQYLGNVTVVRLSIASNQYFLRGREVRCRFQHVGEFGYGHPIFANVNLPLFINGDLQGLVFFLEASAFSKARAIHRIAPHNGAVHQGRQQQQDDQKDRVQHGCQVRCCGLIGVGQQVHTDYWRFQPV